VNSIFHKTPEPTQINGRCIDHTWIRIVSNDKDDDIYMSDSKDEKTVSFIDHSIKTCVYCDHKK